MSHEVNMTWFPDSPLGVWEIVEARTPDSRPYSGTLLVGRVGDVMLCHWATTLGGFTGTGLLHNGRLLAARTTAGAERPGIAWYTLTSTGQLSAVWNSESLGGLLGTGIANPKGASDPRGPRMTSWEILHYDPNGNKMAPPLELGLAASGDVYDMTWMDGTELRFDGVGRATPTGFAAAWSATVPGLEMVKTLLIYEPISLGEAGGTSAMQGSSRLGEEILRRSP